MKEIIEDYAPDDDIFNEEDEKIHTLKHIVYDILTEPDRRILLLYAEVGNYRDLGAELKVSASTAFLRIKQIRKIIYKILNDEKGNMDNN